MHDGIELELNGTPTAVIITEEFEIPAMTIARIRGIPDYPYARVPHPIGSLNNDALLERAKSALPQVLDILTRDPSQRNGRTQ